MHIRKIQKYGWKPSLPDHRDQHYKAVRPVALPASVDLRPNCPVVYDQGFLGCHQEDTEVLTENGWQLWGDYDKSLLATVNPITKMLEYQAPSALQSYEYKGLMHYANHRSLDFAVTPNHRMFVRKWDEKNRILSNTYNFTEIDKIGWYSGLLASPLGFIGTEVKQVKIGRLSLTGDDLLGLIALVISDGWVGATEDNIHSVNFCCFREDRYDMVASLANRIGFNEQPSRKGVFKTYNPELAGWFRANCFTADVYTSAYKRVPGIVKVCSSAQIETFLKYFGDQHIGKNRQFYSSSQKMIDDLQELLLKIGKRSGIYERDMRSSVMKDGRIIKASDNPDITLTEWEVANLSIDRNKHIEKETYNGVVYCATVPNSTLITRRNGQTLISGNSCTANAIGGCYEYDLIRQKTIVFTPSRLFIYYNERVIEGTVHEDAGAELRDGMKTVNQLGVCDEKIWPYKIQMFDHKPRPYIYNAALNHQSLCYAKVDLTSPYYIKQVLAQGFPFAFGFTVYENFESMTVERTGVMEMPGPNDSVLGGHAVMCVGYNDDKRVVYCRNSWGSSWGMKGYFSMPYAYITNLNLAADAWMMNLVEG